GCLCRPPLASVPREQRWAAAISRVSGSRRHLLDLQRIAAPGCSAEDRAGVSVVCDERRLRLGQLALDVRDPLLAGGMIRKERGRLLALGVFQHPLPELDLATALATPRR